MNACTAKKTAANSLIIAVGVFDVCRILQLFFDVFLTVWMHVIKCRPVIDLTLVFVILFFHEKKR